MLKEPDSIIFDRAGGTSHGSGNAPARLRSGGGVLAPRELLERLGAKGVRIDDEETGKRLIGTVGYRHVVRYVPAVLRYSTSPDVSALLSAVRADALLQNAFLFYAAKFERAFKTRLSSALATQFGPAAHMNPSIFKREEDFDSFRQSYRGELVRKARGGSRYAAKLASEGDSLAVWSACEFASFGTVSKLFSNLVPCEAKRNVVSHYGFATVILESWLEAMVFLRNECSHGGVLYGRELERRPRAIVELSGLDNKLALYQFAILALLLRGDVSNVVGEMRSRVGSALGDRHLRAFGALSLEPLAVLGSTSR